MVRLNAHIRKRTVTTGDARTLAPGVYDCVRDLLTDAPLARETAANPSLATENAWREAQIYIKVCEERKVEIKL